MTREVRLRLIAVCAVILFGSVCYFVGRTHGRDDERLAQNAVQIRTQDSVLSIDSSRAQASREEASVLNKHHDALRERIRVYHDTVYVQTDIPDDPEMVYSPAIARLIAVDDSTISAQKRSLQLQDTLIASLRVGISLRDTRIKILEQEVTPGKIKRLITATKWIAVGAVVGVALSHK